LIAGDYSAEFRPEPARRRATVDREFMRRLVE
jgi:hypothetical protein